MKQVYIRIFLLVALLPGVRAYTQEARPAVISGCGGSSEAIAGYVISFTVGEPVIVTAGNNTVFTQGFHQPVSASEYPAADLVLRGAAREQLILLGWTTNTESNNNWFYVEKSADGISFTIIDSVRTRAPNGTSTHPIQYQYADLKPFTGPNYYRLKQVGVNGAIRYSQTVLVQFAGSAWRVHVYPNPVHGTLYVQLYSDQATKAAVTLHTVTGQQMLRSELPLSAGYSSHTLQMGHLKSGVYILSVRDLTLNRKMLVKVVKN